MITLTAANSVFMLGIIGLQETPVQLQGFAADSMFDIDAVEPVQALIGVDGRMSYGYVPYLTKQKISIQSDSSTAQLFELWLAGMKAIRDVYVAFATLDIPSLGVSYTLTNGVLSNIKAIPPAKKIFEPRDFEVTWGSVDSSPIVSF